MKLNFNKTAYKKFMGAAVVIFIAALLFILVSPHVKERETRKSTENIERELITRFPLS